jgi:regulator of replication initiation timing
MPDDLPDLKPEDLAKARIPDPLSPSEKETFEARIDELLEENKALKAEIEKLRETYDFTPKKPKEAKRKSFAERFSPL